VGGQAGKKDPLLGVLVDGKYRVEKKLGGGGMGLVYMATHEMMDRTVALKMLHKHLADSEAEGEFLERFKREAQATASIEHPNAITIHDFGIHEEAPFLVMQYIEGRALKDVLLETGALPLERTLPLMIQVCAAVAEAHRHNIIHRDLKPDNIMISERPDASERATVLDFGIAKIVGADDGNTSVTKVGSVIGTPQYMSPEQVHGKALDARSDLYAVGIILFEMCTGKVPFDSDSAVGLMMKHISEPPPAPRSLAPDADIPPRLEAAMLKALEKDPDDRFQDMLDFSAELEAIAMEVIPEAAAIFLARETLGVSSTIPGGIPAYQDASPTNSTFSTKKLAGSTKKLAGIGGSILIVLLLAIYLVVNAGDDADDSSASIEASNTRPVVTVDVPEKNPQPVEIDERSQAELVQATELIKAEEYDTAESLLKNIIIQYPELAKAHFQLGELYISRDEFNDAVLSLQRASKLQSDTAKYYESLGYAYGRLKRFQDSVRAYLETVRLKPEEPLSHNNLGFAYLKLGELEDAENSFKVTLRLDKEYARAYYNLAEVYKQRKDWERRALALKGAVGVDTENSAAHLALAEAYEQLDLNKQALKSAEKALKLKPRSKKAKRLVARLKK